MNDTLRIGCGAGFAGDRLDAPLDLVAHGKLDYSCSSASPSARSRSRSCAAGATPPAATTRGWSSA